MKQIPADALRGLALDINAELERLRRLAGDVAKLRGELALDPARATLYHENLALKLHNFYTSCERIFHLIASELNGAAPAGFDSHKRLLERMAVAWEGRPALLAAGTLHDLREYLAFRHVVRNIYGYELDPERIERLVARYPQVWHQVESDVVKFTAWLQLLATRLDEAQES